MKFLDHTTTVTGRAAACDCGWELTAASSRKAKEATRDHINNARSSHRTARRADPYRPSTGPARDIVMPPPAPLAGQPDRRGLAV